MSICLSILLSWFYPDLYRNSFAVNLRSSSTTIDCRCYRSHDSWITNRQTLTIDRWVLNHRPPGAKSSSVEHWTARPSTIAEPPVVARRRSPSHQSPPIGHWTNGSRHRRPLPVDRRATSHRRSLASTDCCHR